MAHNDGAKRNIGLEISVLCLPGMNDDSRDNFYVNGRLREWLDSSVVNVVSKVGANNGLYAVTTDMDAMNREDGSYVSLARELRAFSDKYESEGGHLDSKTRVLGDMIEEAENYIHTLSFNSEKATSPSIACMYLQDGGFTTTTFGTASLYQFRDGLLVPMCGISENSEKIERLVELGIMDKKQADDYNSNDASKKLFQLPQSSLLPGDVYALCTGAAAKYLNEERHAALCEADDANSILSEMMRGAIMEGYQDDLTVMIVSVSEGEDLSARDVAAGYIDNAEDDYDDDGFDYDYSEGTSHFKAEEKHITISSLAVGVIACILCLAIGLAVGYNVLPSLMGTSTTNTQVSASEDPAEQAEQAEQENEPIVAPNNKKEQQNEGDVEMTPAPKKHESASKSTEKSIAKPTAKPEATPVKATNGNDVVITAKSSDTFWGIAAKYCKDTSNDTMNKIAKASGKSSLNDFLHAGDKIVIPASLLK